MPRKRSLKRALWQRNVTSGFNFDKCHFSGTLLFMILQNFKKIAQRAAELYAIQLFLYLPTYIAKGTTSAITHAILEFKFGSISCPTCCLINECMLPPISSEAHQTDS